MTNILLPRGYRNAEVLEKRLHQHPENVFCKKGEKRALNLFQAMSERVPAYKDFLKKNKVDPKKIRGIDDFGLLPTLDKNNYLRAYPREALCWDGEFGHGRWVVSTTSGSTGKPFYFPREATQDWQYAISAELYLRNNFQIQKRSTLYVVAFPMGAWIGGLFTYEALRIVADHGGYNLSIITPGIDKKEVLNAIEELGDSFDQIIIGAYAPFLKDILDDGIRRGVGWKNYNLGFVFSAEAFSETFRDYVIEKTDPDNPYRFSLNHYGTVDQGTLAHETPESVLIRRLLVNNDKLDLIFPEKVRQPTFGQYNPELFYFEQEKDNLLCSTFSGLPLVRYDLKDYGGIISRGEVHSKLLGSGIDVATELSEAGVAGSTWNLPFVYVYERGDFSVSYYAFLIYPDTIRRALQSLHLKNKVTGKFTMLVEYDKTGRQRLIVNIEKKHGVKNTSELEKILIKTLHSGLLSESSEYRETSKVVGDVVKPVVKLWEYEDPEHFKAGAKQKWVKK